jgi:hypothetical protein
VQQAELGDTGTAAHAEHGADRRAVEFGDPAALAARVELADELGTDLGQQRLERGVPAVFARVQIRLAMDDPAYVADAEVAQHERLDSGRRHRPTLPLRPVRNCLRSRARHPAA